MALQEKTSKWFADCVKREKHLRKKGTLKHEKERELQLPAHYSHCNYCIKVFYDPKFLVKHILRRHSDKLIELHKNILSSTKANSEKPDLFEFLKAEFSYLKVEVDYLKKVVTNHLEENKDSITDRKNDQKSSHIKRDSNMDITYINTKSDSLKAKLSETCSNDTSNQISAVDFQNLQVRVDKLFQMFRESVVSKEDIEKTLSLNEEKICKTLKNELLPEMHNIILNQQKINKDQYEAQYIELQREIVKLEKLVQLNTKKLESPDCVRDIQNKFESRIQSLLTGHSLFTSIAKRTKNDKSMNSNNQHKLTVQKSKKKMKSIYTSKSDFNHKDLSGSCKNQNTNSSLDHRIKQKHMVGNPHINKESPLFSPANVQMKRQEQVKLHEFNSLVDNAENFSENHLKEVKLLIDEKLKSLNVDPSEKKLSDEEFEKKIRLINSEQKLMENKYKNFSQIRDKIDYQANKVVNSKLGKKLPKKLRFSDSPHHTSDNIDCDLIKQISHTAEKQESSGFIVSDLKAQGDALSNKNFDVENLSPIEENSEYDSETSYTDYPLQSSTHQQNDYESFRKYIPVSPVIAMVENGTAKISKDSLLLKSVEEMSDLSSLDSDILDDECDNLKEVV